MISASPFYCEAVNSMVVATNMVYRDFLRSEEGQGFRGEVSIRNDRLVVQRGFLTLEMILHFLDQPWCSKCFKTSQETCYLNESRTNPKPVVTSPTLVFLPLAPGAYFMPPVVCFPVLCTRCSLSCICDRCIVLLYVLISSFNCYSTDLTYRQLSLKQRLENLILLLKLCITFCYRSL